MLASMTAALKLLQVESDGLMFALLGSSVGSTGREAMEKLMQVETDGH
jgi:hypothetical protein